MNWEIDSGSRISRLPRFAQPFGLLARNLAIAYVKNFAPMRQYHHIYDGIATCHNDGFKDSDSFKTAYARAVKAAKRDYRLPFRVHQALWCSRQAQQVEGDFVECGTGRGFQMSAVLADFSDWNSSGRSVHLFDTFVSTRLDSSGKQDKGGRIHPTYAISFEETKQNFSEWSRVYLHQGDVFDTLQSVDLSKIAFVHIDMNHPDPETFVLRRLWSKITLGGVVLLDDYANLTCKKQYRAMNDLAAELGLNILTTPTGQGIIVKNH